MAKILKTEVVPVTRTGERGRNATVRTLTQYGYGPMEGIKARPILRDLNGVGDVIEKMVGKAWKEKKLPTMKVEEEMGRTVKEKRWKPEEAHKRKLGQKRRCMRRIVSRNMEKRQVSPKAQLRKSF